MGSLIYESGKHNWSVLVEPELGMGGKLGKLYC